MDASVLIQGNCTQRQDHRLHALASVRECVMELSSNTTSDERMSNFGAALLDAKSKEPTDGGLLLVEECQKSVDLDLGQMQVIGS